MYTRAQAERRARGCESTRDTSRRSVSTCITLPLLPPLLPDHTAKTRARRTAARLEDEPEPRDEPVPPGEVHAESVPVSVATVDADRARAGPLVDAVHRGVVELVLHDHTEIRNQIHAASSQIARPTGPANGPRRSDARTNVGQKCQRREPSARHGLIFSSRFTSAPRANWRRPDAGPRNTSSRRARSCRRGWSGYPRPAPSPQIPGGRACIRRRR